LAPEFGAGEPGDLADIVHTAEVQRRAYEIYLGRNGAPGDAVSDWLQAERELRDARATGRS
jgi:hypothetical protein